MQLGAPAIRSFNRFELKYLVTSGQAEALAADLADYLGPDPYGENGRYVLTSLYYDSLDLACYWAKLDGLKVRRKLRIRHYETAAELADTDPVFVEIKQRVNRVTQKRRVRLPYREAVALCEGEPVDGDDSAGIRVVAEAADMVNRFSLRPAAITSYERRAWVGGPFDPGVRVTFDHDLRYRLADLDLQSKMAGAHLLPPDRVVVEVKVNDRVPAWLTRLVSRHNLTLVRLSKYCAAIEAGRHPQGAKPAGARPAHQHLNQEATVRG